MSSAQSEFSPGNLPVKPSANATTLPSADLRDELRPSQRPSLLARSAIALTTFCIGVAATLTWQSYGGAAREAIARSSPRLGWLAPPAAPVAQNAPETIGAAPSPDRQQLEAMSLDLAAVRQSVSQLATTRQNVDQLAAVQQSVDQLAAVQQSVKQLAAQQEQITRNITKLHAAEQNILRKITSAAPPGSAPAHARQPRPSQARQAR